MSMQPKVTLPTGYEQAQKAAASKRKLAEMMLERGLAGPSNPTSWAQVLGQFAQAWAGKSMQKKADRMDADVSQQMLEAYNTKRSSLLADAQTMTPQEIVAKYGNDPLLQDDVKPYQEAVGAALKNKQEGFVGPDNRWHLKGDLTSGQLLQNPNSDVIVDPATNEAVINPIAVGAKRAIGGFDTKNYPQSMPWGETRQANPNDRVLEAMLGQARKDGDSYLKKHSTAPVGNPIDPGMKSTPPTAYTTDGRPAWFINGKYYDNPEGR